MTTPPPPSPSAAADAAAPSSHPAGSAPSSASVFRGGGGAMGAQLRAFDWSATPLGAIDAWPAALRVAVDAMMSSGHPACLFWGPDLVAIHNDGFRVILGTKGSALGQPMRQTWREIWSEIEPIARKALAGEPTFVENFRLEIERDGRLREAWFTFGYGPVFDERGAVLGMLDTVVETTAQVLAERRARSERERQQRVLDQLPGFAAVLEGPDHVYRYVNRAYVELAGARDYLGRTVREVFPELAGQGFFELLDQVFATGEPVALRGVPVTLAGEREPRHVDFLYAPIRDDDGQVSGVFVGGHEVTEHKRAEAALLASRARLHELNVELERRVAERALARGRTWQISSELLCVVDADGRFEMVNPAWTRLLGWREEEFAGRPFMELVHPDDVAPTRAAWADLVERDLPTLRFENRYRTKDGRWRWLSWVSVPDGDKIYASARDVQDIKEDEARLAARTAERDVLARIVETADAFIQVLDPELRFLAINRASADEYERLYGLRPKIGDGLRELLASHPTQLAEIEAIGRRGLAGESFTFVGEFGDESRARRHHELRVDPLTAVDGRRIGAVMTGIDVSERVREQAELAQAQEALRQSQKMEAVGQLTGGLAHDFNNLLAAISGSLEMMRRRLGRSEPVEPAELERFVALGLRSTQRAAALTHRLLAFSRRQTLSPKHLRPDRLVESMQELIARTIGPSIELRVVAEAEPWTVFADPGQLENALLNLCINARDAMPDGGRLTIETANRRVVGGDGDDGLAPGDHVSLCVGDDGCGMSPEVLARAFDPFFTTKPIGVGTGLGLSMVYGFAKQSGGQVRIRSEVGRGTTVCLHLPRRDGEPVDAEAAAPAAAPLDASVGRARTIVVVDDEAAVRELTAERLRELGFDVIVAADGPEALERLAPAREIALLITDVGLPGGLNGRQLADRARELRPRLKVLFVTGYAEAAVIGDGALPDGMHVMTKPFEMEALARRVRELVDAPA